MADIKLWKLNQDSPAGMKVANDSAMMIGAENRFIKVSDKGTVIYGPLSIVAGTESIKTGGMFISLPNLVKMIPSTFVSPIPDQIPFPPIHVAVDLALDVGFFAMLLI